MFHRETDAAKVARNRDAIFDLHARALEFLERYTAIPYPFGKFDFVAIPAFQFGGMEHAGKILYNASGLMLDESATQNQLLGRASVIAHETAHMWFGDLVTMRWFNDVWMKEVFANFMAAKIVNPSFPTVNHDLRFLLSNYPSAYEVDRTPGANPIRQQLDNLDEAGSMYGAIIYQKAPVVMRHLEALLGEDNFRDGLREYLKAHAFANATWSDLITVLDARTPVDLQEWSRAWVDQPGRPTIETLLTVSNGKISRLAFRQSDPLERKRVWPQQLRVTIGTAAGRETLNVDLRGAETDVPKAVGMPAPLYLLPNGGGWGYGDFRLDLRSRDYLHDLAPADRRCADAGQRVGHALGLVARRQGGAGRVLRPGTAIAAARIRRTDDVAHPRLCLEHVVALPRCAGQERPRRAVRIAVARGPRRRRDPEPEGLVVRHLAECRRHARHRQLAAAGVGEKRNGQRAAAR